VAIGNGGIVVRPSSVPYLDGNLLTVGEETFSRDLIISNMGMISGSMYLTYFTSRKSEVTTQVRTLSGSGAATPTLTRVGLFSIDASGDGTRVAVTDAADTTLWASASTVYTRSWLSSYTKAAGRRYAAAFLFTGGTPPQLRGVSIVLGSEPGATERITGLIAGQTDIPASFSAASVAITGVRAYAAVLP
jgi:hypothetical protein